MLSPLTPELPANLIAKAQRVAPVRTAIVNAATSLVMESAKLATEKNLIEPIFVGEIAEIKAVGERLNWDIQDFRTVPSNPTEAAWAATNLATRGEAAALMKGHLPTHVLMNAVMARDTGLRTGRRVSHVFHLSIPDTDQVICITDAAINVLPNVDDKIDIARNAVTLMHALGNDLPNVAVISAVERPDKKIPSSIEASEVAQRAKSGEIKGANVDGPLAFDVAVSATAAEIKCVNSTVSGCADILLVPNIETGNALFKQMVYFMGATAAGIVLGAKVPILLTSRADPPVARVASAALASLIADKNLE